MEEKIDRIEKEIQNLAGVVGTLAEKTSHIEDTVDALARAVAQGFDGIRSEMHGEFVKVRTEMKVGFASVDVRFEQVNGKMDGVHRRIDAELERTLVLESRVVKVEEAVGLTK